MHYLLDLLLSDAFRGFICGFFGTLLVMSIVIYVSLKRLKRKQDIMKHPQRASHTAGVWHYNCSCAYDCESHKFGVLVPLNDDPVLLTQDMKKAKNSHIEIGDAQRTSYNVHQSHM